MTRDYHPVLTDECTYEQTLKVRNEAIWERLKGITTFEAVQLWLDTLSPHTRRNYMSGMRSLARKGFIKPDLALHMFSLVNHNAVIDGIKRTSEWRESTRQARAACYISFTQFLERRSDNLIKKGMPCKEGVNRTFFKVRDKVKTEAINQSQWTRFLEELEKINYRDSLIAKLALQGARRISEVLNLDVRDISFQENYITYTITKTRGTEKRCVIHHPPTIMEQLRKYIHNRDGLVFVTATKKKVDGSQLHNSFVLAGYRANIPVKMTPHVLRTSAITFLKSQGYADSQIMKVSGHSSADMVNAYDKTSMKDNPTKNVFLVN
jgi:integrase/recombinase XerD